MTNAGPRPKSLTTALRTTLILIAFSASSAAQATETQALFLTPLIDAGRIQEARNLSAVTHFDEDVESYSGYLTVDETHSSNMFFWFFPAESGETDAPVLLWLNGGPGVSSLIGAFLENGPLAFVGNGTVERREFGWTQNFSMLYIDNPVGTGYSFTDSEEGLATTIEDVADNLHSALVQFFRLFPEYRSNDFYVGGQSYAGKYVPALGYTIHTRNHDDSFAPADRINMKGIYIGGALCDPPTMLPVYADALFYKGFISEYDRSSFKANLTDMFRRGWEAKKINISEIFQVVFGPVLNIFSSFFDLDNLLGYEATNSLLIIELEDGTLTSEEFLDALHVGREPLTHTWSGTGPVSSHLMPGDFVRNTNRENAFLMENYKVLQYSGSLDVVVSVPMSEAFLSRVNWTGRQQYANSSRKQWVVDEKLAGWFTVVGNFTRVIVRNAGHMVPYDQPKLALKMMKAFVFDEPFHTE